MKIVHLTPGAGGMFCGNCLRDNALVRELRKNGHDVLLVPLYLPLKTDEPDESKGTPVFFGGINVYLQQKSSIFRKAPKALDRVLDSATILNWVSGFAAKTQPAELGALTVSMLRGEHGAQAKELDHLVEWLKTHLKPDVVVLSNALLAGMARRLRAELSVPVVCTLAGEDSFLDHLPEPHRTDAWNELKLRASEMERLIAVSEYYANLMRRRLELSQERVAVVYNGISLDGFASAEKAPASPTVGYFARMCAGKGLPALTEAWLRLKRKGSIAGLKLLVGGNVTPSDVKLVDELRAKFDAEGYGNDVEFRPNLDLDKKRAFFRDITVFSAPATYGEAFGLYIIEALAAGVPVVQPRHGAFPELIEATGGGLLCEPDDPASLADGLEALLLDPEKARTLGKAGRESVMVRFSVERMARDVLDVYAAAVRERAFVGPAAHKAG